MKTVKVKYTVEVQRENDIFEIEVPDNATEDEIQNLAAARYLEILNDLSVGGFTVLTN